jgi:hypothetical protein
LSEGERERERERERKRERDDDERREKTERERERRREKREERERSWYQCTVLTVGASVAMISMTGDRQRHQWLQCDRRDISVE